MMILIGIVPGYFALDMSKSPAKMQSNLAQVEKIIQTIDATKLSGDEQVYLSTINSKIDSLSAIYASVLATLANDDRRVDQVKELTISETLTKAAQLKANDMVNKGYFAHTSPEGLSPWYWFDLAGYDYKYAGENLAVNFADSVDVNKAWMNSPLHRANIVNKRFTEMGIAMATGTYNGREAVYVVQMFGTPIINIASSNKTGF